MKKVLINTVSFGDKNRILFNIFVGALRFLALKPRRTCACHEHALQRKDL